MDALPKQKNKKHGTAHLYPKIRTSRSDFKTTFSSRPNVTERIPTKKTAEKQKESDGETNRERDKDWMRG